MKNIDLIFSVAKEASKESKCKMFDDYQGKTKLMVWRENKESVLIDLDDLYEAALSGKIENFLIKKRI